MRDHRRKSAGQRKDSHLRFRLTAEQAKALHDAAAKAGLDLSTWARAILLRAAEEEWTVKVEMPDRGKR